MRFSTLQQTSPPPETERQPQTLGRCASFSGQWFPRPVNKCKVTPALAIAAFVLLVTTKSATVSIAQELGVFGNYPIHAFLTNCPPLAEVVLKYKYGMNPPEVCLFRFQKDAFFAHTTRSEFLATNFMVQDTYCGYWDGEYWYYSYRPPPAKDAPEVPLSLFTYRFIPEDTTSQAYQATRLLEDRLFCYLTCGIAAGDHSEPIKLDEKNRVHYRNNHEGFSILATFEGSIQNPAGAQLEIRDPANKLHQGHVSYGYSSAVASGAIPSRITSDSGYSIEILSIQFGSTAALLPREHFMPPIELHAAGVEQIVHSNRNEYVLVGGTLIDMSPKRAERNLKDGMPLDSGNSRPLKRFVVIALLLLLPAVVVIVAIRRASKLHQ